MSYYEDRYGGYVGRDEHEHAPRPTFEQMRVLRKLACAKKLTEKQRDALRAIIAWEEDE